MASKPFSLREYFAASAPHEPQEWFVPVMHAPCPEEIDCKPPPEIERPDYADWSRAKAAIEAYHARRREIAAWEAAYEKQRHIQWPWAWADAVLSMKEIK